MRPCATDPAARGLTLGSHLGIGGLTLHEWMFKTDTFQKMFATGSGDTGVENDFAVRGFDNGGAYTIREYLQARLIDELHIAIASVLLGSGENLFQGLDLVTHGYRCGAHTSTDSAMHVVLSKA